MIFSVSLKCEIWGQDRVGRQGERWEKRGNPTDLQPCDDCIHFMGPVRR